jgi:hypothetical protein
MNTIGYKRGQVELFAWLADISVYARKLKLIRKKGFAYDRYNCFNPIAHTDTDMAVTHAAQSEKHGLSAF